MRKRKEMDNIKSTGNGKKALVRKLVVLVAFLVVATSPIFAQDASGEVNNIVGNLVSFFESGWVKGLACIALIAEAIALIFAGGQNPQIFKKFLPLIAGTVIFMCAGKIITLVFGANQSQNFKSDLQLQGKRGVDLPESRPNFEAMGFVFTDELV